MEWNGLPDEIDWTWESLSQANEDVPELLKELLTTTGNMNCKQEALRLLKL